MATPSLFPVFMKAVEPIQIITDLVITLNPEIVIAILDDEITVVVDD